MTLQIEYKSVRTFYYTNTKHVHNKLYTAEVFNLFCFTETYFLKIWRHPIIVYRVKCFIFYNYVFL